MFYTTPTDDGAIAVTCDRCFQSVGCPDPFAAATAITHHHCHPDPAMAGPQYGGAALDHEQPALHLLAGLWVASCPTCGFQLASAQSQARAERRAARTRCPVCHEDA
jgi:cytochrome c-type biogenesis protein CcmH/NrfF